MAIPTTTIIITSKKPNKKTRLSLVNGGKGRTCPANNVTADGTVDGFIGPVTSTARPLRFGHLEGTDGVHQPLKRLKRGSVHPTSDLSGLVAVTSTTLC